MLYLDDRLPTHPKIIRAGELLGTGGASRALHLYLLGLSYARANLTDGFLPSGFVLSCGVVSNSSLCAKALSARGIGLWRKVHGGYVIHDYHDFNPKAVTVKEKREKDRRRKAAERAGRNGHASAMCPDGQVSDSRARGTTYHVPQGTVLARSNSSDPIASGNKSTGAARGSLTLVGKNRGPDPATFKLACVVMGEALVIAQDIDQDASLANAGEYFKTLCAERDLAYNGALARKAYDAVQVARAKRRA
jgi:hypothetical protein